MEGESKTRGIVQLTTDLRSLKYEDASPYTAPLHTRDINGSFAEKTAIQPRKVKSDFLQQYRQYFKNEMTLEGAGLASQGHARIDDVIRIAKFVGTPKGLLWEMHQAALQNTQYGLEEKRRDPQGFSRYSQGEQKGNESKSEEDSKFWTEFKNKVKTSLARVGNTIVSNIGLTAGTLTQTALNGTGYHNDTFISRAYLVKSGSTGTTLWNRMGFTGKKVNGAEEVLSGIREIGGTVENPKFYSGSGICQDSDTLDVPSISSPETVSSYIQGEGWRSGSVIYEKLTNSGSTVLRKFAKTTDTGSSFSGKITEVGTSSHTCEERSYVNTLGGQKSLDRAWVRSRLDSSADSSLRISGFGNVKKNQSQIPVENTLSFKPKDDLSDKISLIPFCLTAITPDNRTYLNFEANLNSFSDNYTGNWNGTQYIGRAEHFYTYTGFDRSVDFSFLVVARNADDLKPLYRKLNILCTSTAPSYDSEKYFMRGTLGSVTIGDLLSNQVGYFKSVKVSWKTDYPWEIGNEDEYAKTKLIRVPHLLDVSVGFVPIHSFNVEVANTSSRDRVYFGKKS